MDNGTSVLWSLVPQQGRSVDLSSFLGIPVDWSFYRWYLPTWDFARARADQTHNHCLTFHGAPVGPKQHLAISIRKLRDHLATTHSELLDTVFHMQGLAFPGYSEDECVASLCFPKSHVVVAGSHGLDDTETVHRKLSGGEELVAKASHSSGGRSITMLRSPPDLSSLLARASPGTAFLVQRRIRSPLIEGRRFHFRLYVGITSLHPLRVYVHHDDDHGGYAVLATTAASHSTAAKGGELPEEEKTCSHVSGVCTTKEDEEFVTNYGDRQKSQSQFSALYKSRTGADPEALLRRMHHSIVVMLLAAGHHSRHTDVFRRLQSLLGEARCFEILGVDFLFEEYEEILEGRRRLAWVPYLIDVTPSPGYGRPTGAASHGMLRDFFRAFVTGDADPEKPTPPDESTDTGEEEQWQAVAQQAASLGLKVSKEDRALIRRFNEEAKSAGRWHRLFPPARGTAVGMTFNYVPLFAGGLSHEDALSMLWAGIPPEELQVEGGMRGVSSKATQVVDEVLNCYFERAGGHTISPREEFVLTQGLIRLSMAPDAESNLGGNKVISNVPAFLVNFIESGCARGRVSLPSLLQLLT
ncbi:Ttll6 [Symbiodinium natans]|uniref:Tubulin--tyrosine ligase-like protein 5 n=1 Tax=Symbiodinium natans TaxID=878477 RepID=A0A812LCI8_9DINO|nr:Ttll6 [Symbiodinium natans]